MFCFRWPIDGVVLGILNKNCPGMAKQNWVSKFVQSNDSIRDSWPFYLLWDIWNPKNTPKKTPNLGRLFCWMSFGRLVLNHWPSFTQIVSISRCRQSVHYIGKGCFKSDVDLVLLWGGRRLAAIPLLGDIYYRIYRYMYIPLNRTRYSACIALVSTDTGLFDMYSTCYQNQHITVDFCVCFKIVTTSSHLILRAISSKCASFFLGCESRKYWCDLIMGPEWIWID